MDLSIIIPVYNVEKYINKCLSSIIEQKTRKSNITFELIIVDDGSEDDSIHIASNILKKTTIEYKIITQKNTGVSVARNHGLSIAIGKYVMFLDSDDYVGPDFFVKVGKEISQNYEIIFWGYNKVNTEFFDLECYFNKFEKKSKLYEGGTSLIEDIVVNKNNWICTCNAMYSKDLLDRHSIVYNSEHVNGEDQEFQFRAILRARNISFIPEVLTYYLIRENSVSTSFNIRKFDSVLALEAVYTLIDEQIPNSTLTRRFNDYIVENFLYEYKAGLKLVHPQIMYSGVKKLIKTNHVYRNILNNRMKAYSSSNWINKIEVLLARTSLYFYGSLYSLIKKFR